MEKSSAALDETIRIDIWAWAVRLFKSRTIATAACRKAHLLVNGERCRPSRKIRVGDRIEAKQGFLTKTVEVKAILSRRVGAKRVDEFLIDHTPAEEYEKAEETVKMTRVVTPKREAGSGRPTKRERRNLDVVMEEAYREKTDLDKLVKAFTKRR